MAPAAGQAGGGRRTSARHWSSGGGEKTRWLACVRNAGMGGREWKTEPKDGVGPANLPHTPAEIERKDGGAETARSKRAGTATPHTRRRIWRIRNPRIRSVPPTRRGGRGDAQRQSWRGRPGAGGDGGAQQRFQAAGSSRCRCCVEVAFRSAKRSGKPVESDWTVPVRFEVKGASARRRLRPACFPAAPAPG
ncbi:Uncharacterised protein [Chromobacterium violaceum]|uniref:Uncharacterized protein n=1 Tax=Chromobacterium violaceum TaxID=536 RepID=A0A3S4J4V3_CHRVL|nr:Uncharacterised protein [Chromobacterium violaceum]